MESYNLRKIVSANVRYYRLKLEYTQEKLAELCDLSPRYVSDIENVRGNIPIDTIEKIANALEIEPYQLLKEHNK